MKIKCKTKQERSKNQKIKAKSTGFQTKKGTLLPHFLSNQIGKIKKIKARSTGFQTKTYTHTHTHTQERERDLKAGKGGEAQAWLSNQAS